MNLALEFAPRETSVVTRASVATEASRAGNDRNQSSRAHARAFAAATVMAVSSSVVATNCFAEVNVPFELEWKVFTPFTPNGRSDLERLRTNVMASKKNMGASVGLNWPATALQSAWLQDSADRIDYFAKKPAGWKGEGSIPPSYEVVEDANALLRRLRSEGCEVRPMISAEEAGGLIFFWKSDLGALSISLQDRGAYGYYLRVEGDPEILKEAYPISEPLPAAIVQALTRFAATRV